MNDDIFLVLLSLYERQEYDDPSLSSLKYETLDPVFLTVESVYKEIMRALIRKSDVPNFKKFNSVPENELLKNWLNDFLINLRQRLVREYLNELDEKGTRGVLTSQAFVYK